MKWTCKDGTKIEIKDMTDSHLLNAYRLLMNSLLGACIKTRNKMHGFGDFDSSIDIAKNTYNYWTMYFQGTRWTAEGFEETLAELINNLWQDLTDAEKQQVKGILE